MPDTCAGRELSPLARSAWAKYNPVSQRTWPLYKHLDDTAEVARQLFSDWFSPSQRALLTETFSTPELAQKVTVWLAAVHDLGKATPIFATKVPDGRRRMEEQGFVFPDRDPTNASQRAYPHGLAGQLIIREYLASKAPKASNSSVQRLAQIVGGHHGMFPTSVELNSPEARFAYESEHESWRQARTELLARAEQISGFTDEDWADVFRAKIPDTAQALLNGYLIVCDWIASDEHLFPYDDMTHVLDAEQRAAQAIHHLNFGEHWHPHFPDALTDYFLRRFGLDEPPRPSQVEAVQCALSTQEPSLFLVEAPTGEGKTETALAVAEILAEKFGLHGAFIALPTQATTNAMFRRVLNWLRRADSREAPVSVALAHSKARFDEEFRGLLSGRIEITSVYDDDNTDGRAWGLAVTANAWTRGRKRDIFADFVIGTIDQYLFAALKAKHASLRHLGLSSKVVILDEVHAADEFMMSYLLRALQWLGAYGVPVIALSATLPPTQRARLLHAYREGARRRTRGTAIPKDAPWDDDIATCAENASYPLITTIASGSPQQVAPAPSDRRTRYDISAIPDDTLVDQVLHESKAGGCIAVVVNTVDRAQTLFSEISAQTDAEVQLFHSRFMLADRNSREQELVRRLGPSAEDRPKALIVVATQVVESSLDVDFDLMFTDLAPSDLLVQRIGRVHRHDRRDEDRPEPMRRARIILTGGQHLLDLERLPEFDDGSVSVYGEALLLRTTAALRAVLSDRAAYLEVPADVPELVRATYRTDTTPPAGWEERWAKAEEEHTLQLRDKRDRSSTFTLPVPGVQGIDKWSDVSLREASDEPRAAAQVRDTEPSLEVVLVRDANGSQYPMPGLPDGLSELQLGLSLDIPEDIAREVATCTVTLPAWLTRGKAMDAVINELEAHGVESWQRSWWLKGQLPLVLDDNLETNVRGCCIRYDQDLGLVVERNEAR